MTDSLDRNSTLKEVLDAAKKMALLIDNERISLEVQKTIVLAQNILRDSLREQVQKDSTKPGHKIWVDGDYKFIYDPITPYSSKPILELEDIGSDIKYDEVEEISTYRRPWDEL